MRDGLERLRHHTVVRRHHDHGDVRDLRAAGTHGGERLVARRVEEHDSPIAANDLAGADVLGDPSALAGRDLGRADGIEQARLAVVDVAHDRHDRGARLQQRCFVLFVEDFLGGFGDRLLTGTLAGSLADGARQAGRDGFGNLVPELTGDERCRIAVDELVDAREDAALDELADDVRGIHRKQCRKLLDRDGRRQLDRTALAGIEDLDR